MAKANFKNMESLQTVQRIVTEAGEAVSDPSRTIKTSPIADVLGGVAGFAGGATVGGAIGFAGLYTLGAVSGISAAGITSGLGAAGAIVGGGMVAGIGVLAAPAVVLGAGVVGIANHKKHQKLMHQKDVLYREAIAKQNAILEELATQRDDDKDRIEYLNSLNTLLKAAIKDLSADLA